ncbi:MAG TPA: hypothetical protein ENH55_10485 [Aurantimonas coralicida]|uniref:Uncharacterized protein n=2 Tax=root TaxID=1 RepID=A0A9C9NHS0_9HYPH|nr:hypothetical protein [Aurantimonas coralicida]HEU01812.1 hypothetical protein [Aurantimonas coralicida]
MATEIISGPKDWWRGECDRCGTEFRCNITELLRDYGTDDPHAKCPTCDEHDVWLVKDVDGYEAEQAEA